MFQNKTQKRKKILESLEQEKKDTVPVSKSFTELPRALFDQVTGRERPEKDNPQNFTQLTDEQLKQHDNPEIEKVRQQIDQMKEKQQEEQWKALEKRQFEHVKAEEKKAIDAAKKRQFEKKRQEAEEEKEKIAQEQQHQQQSQGLPEPKGKVRRSIFSLKKPKKTTENRPSFGKQ
jgi:penicillin-binding protein 1A